MEQILFFFSILRFVNNHQAILSARSNTMFLGISDENYIAFSLLIM